MVGANGVLDVSADPPPAKATLFNVAGSASIADGGKLGSEPAVAALGDRHHPPTP